MSVIRTTTFIALISCTMMACTAVQPIDESAREDRSAIELVVTPERAEVYIDGAYRGRVKGWPRGILPVEPGDHRVALRAEGYIDQRFDITVEPGETYRLKVEMARSLSRPAARPDTG